MYAFIASIIERLKNAFRLWLTIVPHIPKIHRLTIANRIGNMFLEIVETSYHAYYASGNEKLLKVHFLITKLDSVKFLLTIAWENRLIQNKQYEELGRLAKMVPDELLLSETDSPYLAPEPVRGKTNIPRNVKIVVDKLAELKSCSIEHVEIITSQNIKTLFNLN
jgi:hypothetical protein